MAMDRRHRWTMESEEKQHTATVCGCGAAFGAFDARLVVGALRIPRQLMDLVANKSCVVEGTFVRVWFLEGKGYGGVR